MTADRQPSDWLSLKRGVVEVTISPIGAALAGLVVNNLAVVPPVSEAEIRIGYVGSVIAPWPNRIGDGRYSYRGTDYQLECNETDRQTALHGFSAQQRWTVDSQTSDRASLSTVIGDAPGYPWRIRMQAHYRVEEDGVTLSLTCANLSATPAPFGVAFHPYLVIPGSTIDQWILTMGAETVVIPDTERFLPIGQSDVAGAGLDFREGAVIDQEFVNHAFGEFSGPTEATLSSPTGVTIRFESSPECPWMHLYRPDAGPFVGAAVLEPQTSPPNGFVDSRDVVDLVPGEDFHVTWRLSVHTAGNPS